MDLDAARDGPPAATTGRTTQATAPRTETRIVCLPDYWAVYIASGDDPESPDWPISLCDEELRRLRLEGFDTVTCTGNTRELQEYRGIAGTLRAYEALRTGGDDPVTRTVTLVHERTQLPAGDVTRRIALDIRLTLTRSESQPAERLAARAVLEATGFERRVARAWGNADGAPVEPVWLHIDIAGDAYPLPPDAWTHQDAIAARLDSRNCIDRIVLKDPRTPVGRRTATPPWCRQAPFYDHEGRVRCFACDGIKRALADDNRRRPRTSPSCTVRAATEGGSSTPSSSRSGASSTSALARGRRPRPADAPVTGGERDMPRSLSRTQCVPASNLPAGRPTEPPAMILNRRTDRPRPHQIYIGRPSKWGNRFRLLHEDERLRVIALYRADLVHGLRAGRVTRAELAELYGRPLVCWCAPLACHGHVLRAAAAWAATRPGVCLEAARWTREPIERLVRRMARPGARAA